MKMAESFHLEYMHLSVCICLNHISLRKAKIDTILAFLNAVGLIIVLWFCIKIFVAFPHWSHHAVLIRGHNIHVHVCCTAVFSSPEPKAPGELIV